MPLRMRLQMDDGINPFAPAIETFAHPDDGVLRTLGHVWSARADEVVEGFVFESKGLQGAKENRRQRIVGLSEAIETLQEPMEFLFVRISENAHESSLGMTGLHGRPFVAAGVADSGIHQELADPGMH